MQAARGAAVAEEQAGASLAEPGPRARTRPGLVALMLGIGAGGVALDQAAKALALARLAEGRPVPLLGGLLTLNLVRNSGAAFSLGAGATWIFSLLAITALAVILLVVVPRTRRPAWAVAVGLFLAGIAGNLVDRLVRPPAPLFGHVVDFLELPHWPIFNVADMCISAAAVLLVALSLFGQAGHDGRPRQG